MRRKNADESELMKKKGKKGVVPFTFLAQRFDNIDIKTVKRHILYLVL
jgi:hypothetical protein